MFALLKPYRGLIATLVALTIAGNGLNLIVPKLISHAIDDYKRYSDTGLIPVDLGTDGYPAKLENLYKGVQLVGQVDKKIKFLRRLPIDPMTGKDEWAIRSYQDAVDATSWGGEDVYDIHSLSRGVGLNGVPYAKW